MSGDLDPDVIDPFGLADAGAGIQVLDEDRASTDDDIDPVDFDDRPPLAGAKLRILVCGSRKFRDRAALWTALDGYLAQMGEGDHLGIISGMAPGRTGSATSGRSSTRRSLLASSQPTGTARAAGRPASSATSRCSTRANPISGWRSRTTWSTPAVPPTWCVA